MARSSRRTTRKILICSIVLFSLTLSVIFFVELDLNQILNDHEDHPRSPGTRGEGDSGPPCPKRSIGSNINAKSMDQVYIDLKKLKLFQLRMEKNMRELWWYVRKHLSMEHSSVHLNTTLKAVEYQYNSLHMRYHQLSDLNLDTEPFRLNWNFWQYNISVELTSVMRRRIGFLQNPPDCASARKLVCRVAKSCGFGCQVHHVSFCFIMAYATKRTLILDSANWKYSPNGWNAVFQPVSSTCTEIPSGEFLFVTP